MNTILSIILVLEITYVNLYASFICLKKKYSVSATWIVLTAFTFCLYTITLFLMKDMANFGNGNGLFMLIGFLYLIPLNFLYVQPMKYSLTIMCSTWIYTFFVFFLSVRVGYLFDKQWFYISVLLFQTLFYIFTLPSYLDIFEKKLSRVIQNLDNKMLNTLLLLGISWLLTGVLINYTFVVGGSDVLKFINILFLVFSVSLSYKLFYSSVILNNTANELKEQTKKDSLTKLKNRIGFLDDVQQKINKKQHFSIVFMDLDNFKRINDKYGHSMGDAYLIKFANTMKNLFKDFGCFYRMSGDEFIFLYEGKEVDKFCKSVESKLDFSCQNNVKFQGLSLGYASFPQTGNDLSTLLRIADSNMYQNKKEKHKQNL